MTDTKERTLFIKREIVCGDETCEGCEFLTAPGYYKRGCREFPRPDDARALKTQDGKCLRHPQCLEAERLARGFSVLEWEIFRFLHSAAPFELTTAEKLFVAFLTCEDGGVDVSRRGLAEDLEQIINQHGGNTQSLRKQRDDEDEGAEKS